MNLALQARLSTGLSQRQLAKAIGVSRATIIRWEKDQVTIPSVAQALLKVLASKPEETLAIIRNGAGTETGTGMKREPRPRPEPEPVETATATDEPAAADDSASDFAGAGPPPRTEKVDVDGGGADDLWRFGFPTAR